MQCITLIYSAVYYIKILYCAVRFYKLECLDIQGSAVQYSTIQLREGGLEWELQIALERQIFAKTSGTQIGENVHCTQTF